MGRVKRYEDAKTHTVFVRDAVWQKARQLVQEKFGRSISDYLNEHLMQLISEYGGQETPVQKAINYENMKRQYSKLVEDVRLLTNRLKKDGVYEDLMGLAYSLGLDLKDLHNVQAVVPQLFQKWDGYSEHLHLFISLLEIGQKKKALERELTEIRKQMYFSHEGGKVDEADASTHTVQEPRGLSQVRANGAPESP
ncbi:MAG: hypothetical protein ACPLZY_02955 [Candidatus Norongarragalinales archaeon]